MNNWQTKKLSEILIENKKSSLKSKENEEGIYPFFVSGFNIKTIDKYLIDDLCIFLPTGGNFFVHYFDGKAAYSTDTWAIKTNEEVYIKYFYYFLILNQEFISKKLFKGATIKHLQKKDFRDIEIPFPPLPEQHHIARILDEVFKNIDKAKESTEINLQNSKELFETYLNTVFSVKDKLKLHRFDEICQLQRGFDLPTRLRKHGIFPLVSSNGITDKINLVKVKSPGVVTGRSGTIGKVHFITEDFWPLNTSLYVKNFFENDEKCIYYFLRSFDLNKYKSGAGVPTLNRNNVHSEQVYFPDSITKQKEIVKKLDELSEQTKKLEENYKQKLLLLDKLKKSVLQKAFSGEL